MEVNLNRKALSIIGIGLVCLALVVISGGRQLLAESNGVSAVPGLISYQGFLADSNGDPVADGSYPMNFAIYDAASGGSPIWAESQSSVAVSGGFFAVMLGSGSCTNGCPLGSDTFAGPNRYLQVSTDTGGGLTTFPRQQFGSVPYALQAPTGNGGGGVAYENVITVATGGGDYTSVAAALASITDSSSTNRYLVQVMPGVYTETDLVVVKAYVHVRGSGPNATVITSARTGATPANGAATVDLLDNGQLSNLNVRNTGNGVFGIALYSAETTRTAVVDNVVAEAIGAGGTGHYAAYWNDAEAVIRNSTLRATGATGFGTAVNAAFGSVNIGGGFPQALIENSILIGGANNLENCTDNSGTGFGMQLSNSTPLVRGSYICGGHRGIALYTNGNPQIQNSSVKVSSTGSAFLFEISAAGSISVANSGISYIGNKFTGAGTGLRCVHNYDLGTWAALSNGTTVAAACN
ncbi:MAG TPA: pectinesterase family protein [Chloroflexota bacterium]|nr:pectinesterase family protein [Chloroflexota bacterium]